MTSPQKRRANRLNAQRSSGPKTQAGRTIASLNSVKHGLSQPVDLMTTGVNTSALAALLHEDGLDALQAHELVMKILDYERNVAHQLRVFQGWQEPGLELTPEVVDAKARERYPEIDMLDEMIQDELFITGRVSAKDVKKVARIKEAMCRDWIKLHNRQMRAVVRDANSATRYLKRSSNQLIKSLKALGDA
nr:hypothetical protein [uncultured Limnohabitans sp.]